MLQGLLLNAVLAVAPAAPPQAGSPTVTIRTAYAAQEPGPAEEPPAEEVPPGSVPEEKTEEPPPSPERWALMRALQGTLPGALLDDHGLRLYGWAAGSYTASSASSLNTPVVWNDKANEFLLQQFWTRFEKPVNTSASDVTFGFRSDWLVGSDYRFTLPRGIFNGQLTENDGGPNNYGVDPIAFYAEAYIPWIGKGTGVKAGRWFTPFGVESLEAVSSPTVSKSYAFNWAPPFTHTGILATTKLTDTITVAGGPVLGNDIFFDSATEGRFVGTLGWLAPDGRNSVTFGTSVGRGKFNDVENFNNINVFDLVVTHKFSDRLSYSFETIYGYQTNVTRPDNGEVDTVHWLSGVNYLFFTLSPQLTALVRFELFDDFQGSRTGFEGLYVALTVGAAYKPLGTNDVILRGEVRFDHNVESNPFENQDSIGTAALELILRY